MQSRRVWLLIFLIVGVLALLMALATKAASDITGEVLTVLRTLEGQPNWHWAMVVDLFGLVLVTLVMAALPLVDGLVGAFLALLRDLLASVGVATRNLERELRRQRRRRVIDGAWVVLLALVVSILMVDATI